MEVANYIGLKLKSVLKETESVSHFIFELDDDVDFSFLPGQYLYIVVSKNGITVKRKAFSISSHPRELPFIRLTIKNSIMDLDSQIFFEGLTPGDRVKVLPPLGNFTLPNKLNESENYIFFSAGVGLSPLIPMMQQILLKPTGNIFLFNLNRNHYNLVFTKDIQEIASNHSDRFFYVNIFSQEDTNWPGEKGRFSISEVKYLVDKYLLNKHIGEFFICGPGGMVKNVFEGLKGCGISEKNIHFERYSPPSIELNQLANPSNGNVTIIYNQKRTIIESKNNASILQLALNSNLNVPKSCQNGLCGTCKAQLLSGTVEMAPQNVLGDEDLKKGYILACVSKLKSQEAVVLFEDPFDLL